MVTRNESVKERVISQGFQIIKISSDENGEAEILSGVEFTIKAQKDIDKYGSWEKKHLLQKMQMHKKQQY